MRKWFLIVFLILAIPIFFLPKIASTPLGKFFFIKVLEAKSQSRIAIDTMHFSWFGPQTLRQIRWSRGDLAGTIEEFQIAAPFWSFSGTFHLKNGSIRYKGEPGDFVFPSVRGDFIEHTITLQDPLTVAIPLTPALNLPFTTLESAKPALLHIEPKGFSFPIPYSLPKLKIDKATLDLGKVRCQNSQSLAILISLLKTTRLFDAKQLNAWFTPVSLQIRDGILEAGRTDVLLADSIHVCSWGKIDWIQDRVDMILGLPADTLQNLFGIKNLPENYVLKVPLRGSTQNPELVIGPAAAKIAALIASSAFAEIFSLSKEEREVPPPQRPFPWE